MAHINDHSRYTGGPRKFDAICDVKPEGRNKL